MKVKILAAVFALSFAAASCQIALAGGTICDEHYQNGALQGCDEDGECPSGVPNCNFIYSDPGNVNSTPVSCSCQ